MTPLEWRASVSLASLVALRMLGLFLILPVFAIHARDHLPGGTDPFLVGVAMSIYGLTQGLLQLPFGMASDRFGRKRVIFFGLFFFALGSFIAAAATDIYWVIIGRAIQGGGAISAAVTAFLADLTRDEHRTKAMAMVGGSIGFMFAFSLVAAPALYASTGMGGIFTITGCLALAGMLVAWKGAPPETVHVHDPSRELERASLGKVLRDPEMLRLNFGIFALHAMQIAVFVIVPVALVSEVGMPVADHWKLYFPIVILSFIPMVPAIIAAERRGKMKLIFLGSILALLLGLIGFKMAGAGLVSIVVWLLVFFVAFNILEACLPSLVSKLAPTRARGTAIGVYNTTQSLGLFAGGPIAGGLMKLYGQTGVLVFGIVLLALWLIVALPMRPPEPGARGRAPAPNPTQ